MNQTIDWINTIINELVDPATKLKDTLLKVQVLAFKIQNEKLKEWVENEQNGYVGKEVPLYREIPSTVFGNLIQDRGFGSMLAKNDQPLPIEYLEKHLRETLMKIFIHQSVSELEHMVSSSGEFQVNIPHLIHNEITKKLANGWVVESAWQKISSNNIEGIISSIKSNLLTFLLNLADEIGEKDNIDIKEHKNKIDTLFDKTIGNLTGETINISIGTDNLQTVNLGEKATLNIAKGEKITQTINVVVQEELSTFIAELKPLLDKISLNPEDKLDIENEISRIETQLQRQQPKYPIIDEALKVIYGVLLGIAGNAFTPSILDRISYFAEKFTQ